MFAYCYQYNSNICFFHGESGSVRIMEINCHSIILASAATPFYISVCGGRVRNVTEELNESNLVKTCRLASGLALVYLSCLNY